MVLSLATVNFPFVATENCTLGGSSGGARRFTLLAKPSGTERLTDAGMGDADAAEALH